MHNLRLVLGFYGFGMVAMDGIPPSFTMGISLVHHKHDDACKDAIWIMLGFALEYQPSTDIIKCISMLN